MIQNSASGATTKAVTGAAEDSKAMANPNTRPCRARGTTRWMTVCSAASTAGNSAMYSQVPAMYSHPHSRIVNKAPSRPSTITTSSMVRRGLLPSPTLPITAPPTMNPVDARAKRPPHISTENSSSP